MKIDATKTVKGYNLFDLKEEPIKEFPPVCRKAAVEGAVLLKNDNNVLPFKKGEKISVFGRTQIDYYKSGTGSGGLVNVMYVTNIIDSLKKCEEIEINDELLNTYKEWLKDNPFDVGSGWASEPWCQKEMPVSKELAEKCAKQSDKALVCIGRTAGEDKDNHNEPGSYLLNDEEKAMLKSVCDAFDKVCVILNVGNIIDMSFVEEYGVDSVMYVWHGGMEGGNAVADLLTGKVNPSGKLSDTIVKDINDYPSNSNFGDPNENFYVEDIYVGYRYFETFCPEKVLYPFGFGLSYTTFDIKFLKAEIIDSVYSFTVSVTNTGDFAGKEVVQCYFSAPQGKLGKPKYQLCAYKKTKELSPNESETVTLSFPIQYMASFDDSGITGNKNCFVLEKGVYEFFIGNSVKNLKSVETYGLDEDLVVEELCEALAPVKDFDRIKPVLNGENFEIAKEKVPTSEIDLDKRIIENRPEEIAFTGDKGYKLVDVADGKCTMNEFVAQLSDFDMRCMVKGEGMNSHKVTAGTGGAFGGVTENLLDFGIPVLCVTDGPSGIRLDSGNKATAMPIGTALACTFNDDLVEELHVYEGLELRANKIDALLGPGMNIHRHPLNGRNFEYFSEDPILSGKMASAICRGIEVVGPTATIKHFVCNNQEIGRSSADSVVSQRALREIYLKGFEIAVKEGKARALMTSYNPTNGFWCAGNYDLTTTILRDEWNYQGFVMTDWWAKMNTRDGEAFNTNTKQMVRAQNDVFMVCKTAEGQPDNIEEGINEGYICRADLQRCCINLLNYILKSPTFENYVLGGCVKPQFPSTDDSQMKELYAFENIENDKEYPVTINEPGDYIFVYDLHIDADELAQFWCSVQFDGCEIDAMSISGTNGKQIQIKQPVKLQSGNFKFKIAADTRFVMDKVAIKN
ncbi:MAG: glycoside hydrolase family 3 C-terminal domain-containing protein [Acutalibacteraceae bacterium]|nr:glycoside hydrolase family 3 C-terminal domain-containing protein [Acutalibacteraceae bacterium]